MRRRTAVLAALAVSLVAMAAPAAGADSGLRLAPAPSKFPEKTFRVTLPEEVALKPGLIRVSENGTPIEDLAVSPVGGRSGGDFGAALLIDASESMIGDPLVGAMRAARTFADRRKPAQQLAIVSYNAETRVILPFTSDDRKIEAALAKTPPVAYWTRMHEAIERTVALTQTANLSHAAIVLLSDGQELGSRSTIDSATAAARAAGVRVFTVALMSRYFDSSTLRSLASRTGGEYFEATSTSSLIEIYRKLGTRLANEYLIQYRSYAGPGEPVRVKAFVAGIEGSASAAYRAPKLELIAPPPAYHPSVVDRVIQSPVTMLLLAALVACLVGMTAITLIQPRRNGFRNRLGAFVAVANPAAAKRQTTALSELLLSETERSLRKTKWWAALKEELEIGQIHVPAEQIIVLTFLGTIFLAWMLAIFASTIFVLTAVAVPVLVRMFIKARAERQRRAFADQLPDNLQVLSSALRAGHSLIGALSVVVDDAPEPSQREFRRVVTDEQLGVTLDAGLTRVADRMHSRDLEQVALVAALQRETGGNSAEVLDRVAETVRERAALRRLVRTLTAQGRMARWIVSAIPVLLVLIISFLNTEYMTPLYTRTAGQILLVLASLMVISGSLVIRRIVNIKV